jgi:hypothetical protein
MKIDPAKYKNSDKRCTYPWEPGPCGYCWSYAHHVDGNPKFADMERVCQSCEFWTESVLFESDTNEQES